MDDKPVFIILAIAFILAAWKWGDWRTWQKYHSTILYFLFCDALYNYFTYEYPLWRHTPISWIPSYTGIELLAMICFACTPLIYLGRFPNKRWKSISWVFLWVSLYSAIEGGLYLLGAMKYDHGWTFLHSVLFNMLMFPMLRLHFKHPLFTYLLSVPITITLLHLTKVPVK
ncbi:CBO0543 family protein [Paenibacillus flagellatus]|uniref:CBO0543 family protein n=1 Tax=Paenibacillus flagellatus TaxID=2211139 RepID=UPI000DA1EE04|nr:CBO0543 family protein [Paenibacillus flagellatus]